jgi:hypothetical protein
MASRETGDFLLPVYLSNSYSSFQNQLQFLGLSEASLQRVKALYIFLHAQIQNLFPFETKASQSRKY